MPIDALRTEIDRIDEQIIDLIAKRQQLAARMAHIKMAEGLPVHDAERTHDVLEHAFNYAVEKSINPVSVQKVFALLIEMSEEKQRECQGDGNLP
ncbi:MAG: chorismate mutase [Methanolinea sp.]|nr:chorismate mutase [Methanolinea sp.]